MLGVKFIIGSDGRVQAAALSSTSLFHAEVESCVVDVMRKLEFPKPHGDGIVVVTYPFIESDDNSHRKPKATAPVPDPTTRRGPGGPRVGS